jgi:DNA-binding XRE family transcriptional regulator
MSVYRTYVRKHCQLLYRYSNWMPRSRVSEMSARRGRDLGEALRTARSVRRISREAVSRAAGVSIETLRKIENGDTVTPEFFTVVSIARVLGLSLDQLANLATPDVRGLPH